MLMRLTLQSLANRRLSVALTVVSIAIAVLLLLGVERLRTETRNSFLTTIAGTDLIVGARTGSVQLLLFSVFRLGAGSNNLSWDAYQTITRHPYVAWAIPMSLGDSHRGYRVLGTNDAYFQHLRYGDGRGLEAASGSTRLGVFDAVLGATVARALGYQVGDAIIIAHGTGQGSFALHDNLPFTITGILAPTGTPVDQTIHVSLEGIEAIHIGWESGVRAGAGPDAEAVLARELQPKDVSAFMLGVRQRMHTFQLQRAINEYPREPLMAILPGVALQELWNLVGVAERALLAVSALVVLTGLTGMITVILSGLNERRREIAILRSVGARPIHVFGLLVVESTLIGLAGAVGGLLLLYGAFAILAPMLASQYGLFIAMTAPSTTELRILGAVIVLAFAMGFLPGWRAYRNSLADGLSIRI
jgi:putative ABC transport system permease protein